MIGFNFRDIEAYIPEMSLAMSPCANLPGEQVIAKGLTLRREDASLRSA